MFAMSATRESMLERSSGGSGIGRTVPPALRDKVAPLMADAFGATFWYALGLVVIAFVVAVVLLPKSKPEPVEEEPGAAAPGAPAMAMH